jgi:hypothetical protein
MTNTPGANTSNQPTDRSRIHDELVTYRTKLVNDYQAVTARHERDLAELDAAIAAVTARRMPQVGVEYEQCRNRNCGGWIIQDPLGIWIHDRDGSPACQPGHSGPVAQPIDQTTTWPAVAPAGADDTPWSELVGQFVAVQLKSGTTFEGLFEYIGDDAATFLDPHGAAAYPLLANIASITPINRAPADLDTPTKTPAASTTLPDEASA